LVIEPTSSSTLLAFLPLSATGIARPSRRRHFFNVCDAVNGSVSYLRMCVTALGAGGKPRPEERAVAFPIRRRRC
jgi:hypothetical protein